MLLASVLLIASNLVLQTNAARGRFEKKLERRSGLDWTIGSLSWTPWTGIHVGDVKAELLNMEAAGEARPLYQVQEIEVQIYWLEVLNGLLEVREIRLKNGRVAIPIELMALLPKKEKESNPALADEGADPKPTLPSEKPGSGAGADSTEKSAPKTGHGPLVERPPAARPVKLVIDGCELRLYSISDQAKSELALKNVRAEVPLAGEDREGWIETDGLYLGGRSLSAPMRSGLEWKQPLLLLPTTTMRWAGLEVHAGASIRVRNVPRFFAEVRVPATPLEATPVPGWPELAVSSQKVTMFSQVGGSLNDFRSWRGSTVIEATHLNFKHKMRTDGLGFESARLTTGMRGGTFQVVDARLLSERLSFLGNAIVVPDGRVRGVLRIVADRESATAITRLAVGSLLSQGWTRSWFKPLITPDRQFRDLHVEGTLSKAMIDVGRKGEELEVLQAWDRMFAFVRNEEKETEQGVAPTLDREGLIPQ